MEIKTYRQFLIERGYDGTKMRQLLKDYQLGISEAVVEVNALEVARLKYEALLEQLLLTQRLDSGQKFYNYGIIKDMLRDSAKAGTFGIFEELEVTFEGVVEPKQKNVMAALPKNKSGISVKS